MGKAKAGVADHTTAVQTVAQKTVLLIDPTYAVDQSLSKVLDHAGWRVEHAKDNAAALALVQSRPFDVIISSERTSAKDDLVLLHKIRIVRPHTRMIILTNESTPKDVVEAIRGHAFGLFTRPFELDDLVEMLEAAMKSPSWDDGIEVVSGRPEWLRVYARCDLATADRLTQFVHEIAEDVPDPERGAVGCAFREMLLNAIEHGGHFDPSEYVEISYIRTQRAVACRIRDPGKGFKLEEIPHAAASNPPDEPLRHQGVREAKGLRAGGYGVLLARELVDDVIYSEKGNEVVLVKYLDQDRAPAD
jgi:anti-sigma regulatory factor (Ser/Thr protein kinase)/ActR/RegA family two-component response regulator